MKPHAVETLESIMGREVPNPAGVLTPAQHEAILGLVSGLPAVDVATGMGRSRRTLERHVDAARARMGMTTRQLILAVFAWRCQ